MADDTRQSHTQNGEVPSIPEQSPSGEHQNLETFYVPPESANVLPGGTVNTAGGRPHPASIVEAAKSIRLEEFKEIHKKPCVRDALLAGGAGGFAFGGIRAVIGASVTRSCNWAVGGFAIISFFAFEACQLKRSVEKANMQRAAVLIEQKRTEREHKLEEARKARRKAKEDADERLEAERKTRNKPFWKFW